MAGTEPMQPANTSRTMIYEARAEGSELFVIVGTGEKTARKRTANRANETGANVHFYRSHPSPGPQRRYVGFYRPDGSFVEVQ